MRDALSICSKTLVAAATVLYLVLAPALADLKEADALSKRATELRDGGNYLDAIPLAERALELAAKELADGSAPLATFRHRLALLYFYVARYEPAEALYKQAIAAREKADRAQYGDSVNDLGLLYWESGRYSEAERFLKQAIEHYLAQYGPSHGYVAAAQTNLGLVYRELGRYEEAETLMKSARAIREKLKTPTRDQSVANSLHNLAGLYRDQGRYREAGPLARQALELRRTVHGPDHPNVATSMNLVAEVASATGHLDEAEGLLKGALAIRQKSLGSEHRRVATTLNSIGNLHEKKGDLQEAEKAYLAALAIREKQLKPHYPDHPDLATSRANLGALYKSLNRLEDAEPLLRSALDIREKKLGAKHPDYIKSLNLLGDLMRLRGRPDEADRLFDRARSIRKSAIREVPVFFGTDRNKIGGSSVLKFGAEQSKELTFGVVDVWVPTESTPSHAADELSAAAPRTRDERESSDETTQLSRLQIRKSSETTKAEFVHSAKDVLRDAQVFAGHALVFVHGFNVSFDNAVRRAAQLAYDLRFDGPVFLFAWPSRGGDTVFSHLVGIFDYTYDRTSAENARDNLHEFLETAVGQTGAKKIHLIAHSMGNKTLLEALRISRAANTGLQKSIGEIILAAPDVEREQFEQLATGMRTLTAKKTLYASGTDRALWLSRQFWKRAPAGYVPRGEDPMVVEGVETIDITLAGDSSLGLNHDVYASNPAISEDMRLVLERSAHPPDHGSRGYPKKATRQGRVYWYFRGSPPRTQP